MTIKNVQFFYTKSFYPINRLIKKYQWQNIPYRNMKYYILIY